MRDRRIDDREQSLLHLEFIAEEFVGYVSQLEHGLVTGLACDGVFHRLLADGDRNVLELLGPKFEYAFILFGVLFAKSFLVGLHFENHFFQMLGLQFEEVSD